MTYHITIITREDFFLMIKETTYCKRSVSIFDEIKHRHTLNEVDDVAEGRYDWKIERGRGGISL